MVAALAGAAAAASLSWPIGYDLGLYAWTADVVMRGGFVYRDAWDMHGPLVAYLTAIPLRVFGRHVWSLRLFDLLVLAVGIAGISRIARSATSAAAVRWGAVLFVLFHLSLGHNDTAQPDAWAALLAAAAFAPTLAATRPRVRQLALAGFAVGVCIAIKPTHGLLLAVPLVHAVVASRGAPGAAIRAAATLATTAALPVAAVAVWFAAHGALDALLEVHLQYPRAVYTFGSGVDAVWEAQHKGAAWLLRGRFAAVAWPAVIVGAVALWRGGRRALCASLLVWLAGAVLPVLLQGKYYVYHWLPTWPPIATLGIIGLGTALAEASGMARVLAAAMVVTLLGHAALRPTYYALLGAQYGAGLRTADSYYARFTDGGVRAYPLVQAAEYLRPRLGAGEGVALWGSGAALLWHVDRPTPFRLAGWSWPVVQGEGSPWRDRYRDEYVQSMRSRPPRYFVIDEVNPAGRLADFRRLAKILAAEYRLERTIRGLQLFRRIDVTATAPAGQPR